MSITVENCRSRSYTRDLSLAGAATAFEVFFTTFFTEPTARFTLTFVGFFAEVAFAGFFAAPREELAMAPCPEGLLRADEAVFEVFMADLRLHIACR